LPHSHPESNDCADDVYRSPSIFQREGDEDDTADSKTSTVGCEGVVQFVVSDTEFFVVDLPDDGADIQTRMVSDEKWGMEGEVLPYMVKIMSA
jgi:hypothetical protein